jgi:hypothetical protein
MIGVVRAKNMMVNEGVGLEGVAKTKNGAVHDIAMQEPFEKGGRDHRNGARR